MSGEGNELNPGITVPCVLHGLNDITGIAFGAEHGLVLDAGGPLWLCGYNRCGQPGDGTFGGGGTLETRVHIVNLSPAHALTGIAGNENSD